MLRISPLDRAVHKPTSMFIMREEYFWCRRSLITGPVFACTILVNSFVGVSGMSTPSVDAVNMRDLIESSSFSHPDLFTESSFFSIFLISLRSLSLEEEAIISLNFVLSIWAAEEFATMRARDYRIDKMFGSIVLDVDSCWTWPAIAWLLARLLMFVSPSVAWSLSTWV